jgi:hypothetical protein
MADREKVVNAMQHLLDAEQALVSANANVDGAREQKEQMETALLAKAQQNYVDNDKQILVGDQMWTYDGESGDITNEIWTGVVLDGELVEASKTDREVIAAIRNVRAAKINLEQREEMQVMATRDVAKAKDVAYKACHAVVGEKRGCKPIIFAGYMWDYSNGELRYRKWNGIVARNGESQDGTPTVTAGTAAQGES